MLEIEKLTHNNSNQASLKNFNPDGTIAKPDAKPRNCTLLIMVIMVRMKSYFTFCTVHQSVE